MVTPTSEPPLDEAKIARVRREIAAGTYETPDKLEAAVEAMLDGWEESDGDDSDGNDSDGDESDGDRSSGSTRHVK